MLAVTPYLNIGGGGALLIPRTTRSPGVPIITLREKTQAVTCALVTHVEDAVDGVSNQAPKTVSQITKCTGGYLGPKGRGGGM